MYGKEKLAKKIYDCYCAAVGGKAFNGDQLPSAETFFKDLTKTKQADAWREVARLVIDEFINA